MRKLQVLFYVNQIYLDESTGQGSFERGLIMAFLKHARHSSNADVRVFSVHRPGSKTKFYDGNPKIKTLLLDKDSYWGYLIHQLQLIRELVRELWRYRNENARFYVRYNPSMIAPALLALLFRRRLVFRTGPVFRSMRVYRQDLGRWVYPFVTMGFLLFCWKAHTIIVATKKIREWIAGTLPFVRHKIMIIHNGVNAEQFYPLPPERKMWGLPEEELILGFTGSLTEVQGLHTVIRAIAKIRDQCTKVPYLFVVGDGPCLKEWQNLAVSLEVNNYIIWAGNRPHVEIPSAISSCDIMLLPLTKYTIEARGTSSMKLFEYLACDKFVLASRCEDLMFLEQNNVGRLVEPENVNAWAVAIQKLLNTNWSDLDIKGHARNLTVREYSFDAVAEKIWSACFD